MPGGAPGSGHESVQTFEPVAVRSSGIAEDLEGAVVAAEGATARLRDGMVVMVDGNAGTVEIAA